MNYMSSSYIPSYTNKQYNKSIPLTLNIKLGIMILFSYIVINGMSNDIQNSIKKEFKKHTISRTELFGLLYQKLWVVPIMISIYWVLFNIILKIIYFFINRLLHQQKKCDKKDNNTSNNSSKTNNNSSKTDNNSSKTDNNSSKTDSSIIQTLKKGIFSNKILNKTKAFVDKSNKTKAFVDKANKTKAFVDKAKQLKTATGFFGGEIDGHESDKKNVPINSNHEIDDDESDKKNVPINLFDILTEGIKNDILLLIYVFIFNILLISVINVLMVLPSKDGEINEDYLSNIFLIYKVSYILSFLVFYMQLNLQ
jgi:hypothetical protein